MMLPRTRIDKPTRSPAIALLSAGEGSCRNCRRSERASIASAAAILEKPVSDRGTLEDLSQSRIYRSTCGRKLLTLNGEMSEWLKEHAWKWMPAARADAHQHPPTQFPLTTSRNNDVRRRVPSITVFARGFGGHVTQF